MAQNTSSRRFSLHTQEEINKKKEESTPKNTRRANDKAGRIFRAYLLELEDGRGRYDFEDFDTEKLDRVLEGFWYSARDLKGNKYKASTLDNIRHSLNRYLKSPPFNKKYDIIKDKEFRSSNEAFKGALRELKDEGKGNVQHYPEIKNRDLQTLYSKFNCSSPVELQEKVQFDIRFYFFRRGSENMHKMNKTTFVVNTNPETGERYVAQASDELTKNHQGDCRESHTALMPEMPGDNRCPVASYLQYIKHLHPQCNALWARPKANSQLTSDVWYYNCAIGVSILGKFMKDLSVKHQLSQVYTNHSIRVTGAIILTRKKFAPSQIKAVTGHRSVSSLAIYQRVSEEEKIQMGQTLSESVGQCSKESPSVPCTSVDTNQDFQPRRPPPTCSKPPSSPLCTVSSQDMFDIGLGLGLGPSPVFSTQHAEPEMQNQLRGSTSTLNTTSRHSVSSASPDQAIAHLQPIDFNLSPYLRDLQNDPDFEESTELTITRQVVGASQTQSQTQHVNVRHVSLSPPGRHSGLSLFSGCTIHNVVINYGQPQNQPQ